jgi:P pilus assembly chaperone PapD
MSHRRYWLGALLVGWGIASGVPTAVAQVSLSVAPLRVELQVPPGAEATDAVNALNEGEQPAFVRVSTEDWYLTEEGTPIFTASGSQPGSASPWIRVNPTNFRLNPGESRDIRYTLTVPRDAAPGTYRTAIVVEASPGGQPTPPKRQVLVKGRIVSIIYETVGTPQIEGDLTSMKVRRGSEGVPEVLVVLENTGRYVFRTGGTVRIKDGADRIVAELTVPSVPVLPRSRRAVAVSAKDRLAPGKYTAVATIDIGRRELFEGEVVFTWPPPKASQ